MNEKKKVLIIEDNIDLQELYKIYFEEKWFEVYSAYDWLRWIVETVEKKPDIILLDIMMPEMNWFEVLESIKNQTSIATPIIVLSNLSKDLDIKKAMDWWASLYLKKSDYDWDELVEKVVNFLNESENKN